MEWGDHGETGEDEPPPEEIPEEEAAEQTEPPPEETPPPENPEHEDPLEPPNPEEMEEDEEWEEWLEPPDPEEIWEEEEPEPPDPEEMEGEEWLEPPDPEEIWEEGEEWREPPDSEETEEDEEWEEWLEPPDPEEIWEEEPELEEPGGKNEWLEPPDPEEIEGKEGDEGPEPPDPEETEEGERVGPLCEGGVEGGGGAERVGEGEGASKLRRWDRVGVEGLAVSPERGFTHSREWGRRETPGGGWAEYYAEAASVRDEGTGATAGRTYVFARGETAEGDRVTGVGRADGAEFPVWVEGWFDEMYVRAGRSSVVESWETGRPVEASLLMLPPGADVREELRVTRDPALRDLRAFGWSREFWTDGEGYPTVRSTRWLVFQRDEGEERRPGSGDRARVVVVARTDAIQLRPGREGIINRSSYTTFFPLGGGEREAGGAGHQTEEEDGRLWASLLRDRGEGGSRNDYRFEGGFTRLVYRPPESGAGDGEVEGAGRAVGLTGEAASGETAVGASEEGEEIAGEAVEDAVEESLESTAGEASGAADAGEAVEAVESTPESGEAEGTGKGGEAVEAGGSAAGSCEESVEGGENSTVRLDGGEEVSVDGVLRMVGEGIFRAGGEEEYRRRLRERGVEFDYGKLGEMLLEQRRLPEEVYRALKSLAGEEGKKGGEEEERVAPAPAEGKEEEGEGENRGERRKRERRREQRLRGRLGLEDLFVIVSNVVRGVAYSVSRREFVDLLREAVRRCGGEKGFVERFRGKPGPVLRLLYEMLGGGEVSLRHFGAVLRLAEESRRIEERVRGIVEKTRELLKQIGLEPSRGGEGSAPDGFAEGGGEDSVEELRRRGYAALGRRIGEYLSGGGLLDDWVIDLIAACEERPTPEKEGFEGVLERLRRVWKSLGVDADSALAPLVEEVFEELGRGELLILLYNARKEPFGRRGVAASFVDVLEILVEATRKAGGVEGFLEIVREKTGRVFYPNLLDEMLAARRLDKDVLRVALEYVYETEENKKVRIGLLERNTEYILKRLTEEAAFLSRLEPLLEPLAELNRRLQRSFGQSAFVEWRISGESQKATEKVAHASMVRQNEAGQEASTATTQPYGAERGGTPTGLAWSTGTIAEKEEEGEEAETTTPVEEQCAVEAETGETISAPTTGSEGVFSLVARSLLGNPELEEKSKRTPSEREDGENNEKEGDESVTDFLLGERNLLYIRELLMSSLLDGLKEAGGEGREGGALGEELEKAANYAETLLKRVEETLLREEINELSGEEAQAILEAAATRYKTKDREEIYKTLSKETSVSTQELQNHLERTYNPVSDTFTSRRRLTRKNYLKICRAAGIPPRNKKPCRVDLLRTLIEENQKLEETSAENKPPTGTLKRKLKQELEHYETIEREAIRIHSGEREEEKEGERGRISLRS